MNLDDDKGQLQIITYEDSAKWKALLETFPQTDVYYTPEYVSGYSLIGEGSPLYIYYEGRMGMRLGYVVQQNDIARSSVFSGLEQERYFDWNTPYGYGGPLVDRYNNEDMFCFFTLLKKYCIEHTVVSQFVRFHPIFGNNIFWNGFCDQRLEKDTIVINITNKEEIWENLDSKNRNMIRKAQKNEIEVSLDTEFNEFDSFFKLYHSTMQRNEAQSYYYFSRQYLFNLKESLQENIVLFHAKYKGKIIASTMILKHRDMIHYHLSGADREFMHLAPNNLLLFSIANWGSDLGLQSFHLGGGISKDDSLYAFKKAFNKKGVCSFYIGANIFCENENAYLKELRKKADPSFTGDGRMIQYRKGE